MRTGGSADETLQLGSRGHMKETGDMKETACLSVYKNLRRVSEGTFRDAFVTLCEASFMGFGCFYTSANAKKIILFHI